MTVNRYKDFNKEIISLYYYYKFYSIYNLYRKIKILYFIKFYKNIIIEKYKILKYGNQHTFIELAIYFNLCFDNLDIYL